MTTIITDGKQIYADARATTRSDGRRTFRDNAVKVFPITNKLTFSYESAGVAKEVAAVYCAHAGSLSAAKSFSAILQKLPVGSNLNKLLPALAEGHKPVSDFSLMIVGEGAAFIIRGEWGRDGTSFTYAAHELKDNTIVGIGSGAMFAESLNALSKRQKMTDVFIAAVTMDRASSICGRVYNVPTKKTVPFKNEPKDAQAILRRVLRSVASDKTMPLKASPVSFADKEYT